MQHEKPFLRKDLRGLLPSGLQTYLSTARPIDISQPYVAPENREHIEPESSRKRRAPREFGAHLPGRLENPIIPYDEYTKEYIRQGNYDAETDLHTKHYYELKALHQLHASFCMEHSFSNTEPVFDLSILKTIAKSKFSVRTNLMHDSTLAYAITATNKDISISAMTNFIYPIKPMEPSPYLSILIFIQKLRVMLAVKSSSKRSPEATTDNVLSEGHLKMNPDGSWAYHADHPLFKFGLVCAGSHFRIYHSAVNKWYAGTTVHLDYLFTVADILNNLHIIGSTPDYKWASGYISFISDLAENECDHNLMVSFMKNTEPLLLNLADQRNGRLINWATLTDTLLEMIDIDKKVNNVDYPIELAFMLIEKTCYAWPKQSYVCRMLVLMTELEPIQLLEVSSLHKTIFYAEINAAAGVEKFLKRVHTPRRVDPPAIKNLTRMAKKEFFFGYIKKHQSVPNMRGEPTIRAHIASCFVQDKCEGMKNYGLTFWDSVLMWDCMDVKFTDDPIQFSKDKGAVKKKIRHGPGDAYNELLQVLDREVYTLEPINRSHTFRPLKPRVYTTKRSAEELDYDFPTRLIEKEKEQKEEARLFANASLENKHGLSMVTARMKQVLSYYDSQLMTPTDKARKKLLHDIAQKLREDRYVSILADIEGHNQSMQSINTAELTEFIGHLFGEEGWSNLPDYFSALHVYHYDNFRDKVTVSEGQLGGIEGWLNPLWTLHSTCVAKLINHMTDIRIVGALVYSDDLELMADMPERTQVTVDATFLKLSRHFMKFGLIVKPSQAAISEKRATILRQHYYDGERADSTLKRLLAVSGANNTVLFSEDLEVGSISSSIASALELSNHPHACVFLKHYKIGLLMIRSLQNIFKRSQTESFLGPEKLPTDLVQMLYSEKDESQLTHGLQRSELVRGVTNGIIESLGKERHEVRILELEEALEATYRVPLALVKMVDSPDKILFLITQSEFLQDLLFFLTHLPSSIGGTGASLYINMTLSGHSEGLTKSTYYLSEWCKKYSSNKRYFTEALFTALTPESKDLDGQSETRMIGATWYTNPRIISATTYVNGKIKQWVSGTAKNLTVKKLFSVESELELLKSDLLELFRDQFHHRIVQFYFENSISHFLSLLLRKVTTSSGMLSKIPTIKAIRKTLAEKTMQNWTKALTTRDKIIKDIGPDEDVIDFLTLMRSRVFPEISFAPVEEIMYDDRLKEITTTDYFMQLRMTSRLVFRDGMQIYSDLISGSETLYKGEMIDEDRQLGSVEEAKMAALVSVTKWFLSKSGLDTLEMNSDSELNVIKACNASLSTLGEYTYDDLRDRAPLELGGEILHRIPSEQFKASTSIRTDPQVAARFKTDISQMYVNENNWADSNINFDYLRLRIHQAAMTRYHSGSSIIALKRYVITRTNGIVDVRFIKPYATDYTVKHAFTNYENISGVKASLPRLRFMAMTYLYSEDMTYRRDDELDDGLALNSDTESVILSDLVFNYYQGLLKNFMTLDYKIIDLDLWAPLIKRMKGLSRSWRETDDTDMVERIVETLSERLDIIARTRQNRRVGDSEDVLREGCLAHIRDNSPQDVSFGREVNKILVERSWLSTLDNTVATQRKLKRAVKRREDLDDSAILWLILKLSIMFCLEIKRENDYITLDAVETFSRLREAVPHIEMMLLSMPEDLARLYVIGANKAVKFFDDHHAEFRKLLFDMELSQRIHNLGAPTKLPSLEDEPLPFSEVACPESASLITYTAIDITYGEMKTLKSIVPLTRYARAIVDIYSSPDSFYSPTGSDSYMALNALFRKLLEDGIITERSKIIDLTAGRGDGLYASKNYGLRMKSYSRRDAFTSVRHHPEIEFSNDYDATDPQKIPMIIGADFVLVDISFAGTKNIDLSDLVLTLEKMSSSYAIRLNSVEISKYLIDDTIKLPHYKHSLYYCASGSTRCYQIYLVGVQDDGSQEAPDVSLKAGVAYRAMAQSYTMLISLNNLKLRATPGSTNSISTLLPENDTLNNVLNVLLVDERLDFARKLLIKLIRQLDTVGPIVIAPGKMDNDVIRKLQVDISQLDIHEGPVYRTFTEKDIGQTSSKSRPYHIAHLTQLQLGEGLLVKIPYGRQHHKLYEWLRGVHPLHEVRSLMSTFCDMVEYTAYEVTSDIEMYKASLKEIGLPLLGAHSRNQKELMTAINLIIESVRRNDYYYGLYMAYSRVRAAKIKAYTDLRVLKYYRMLSAFYDTIKEQQERGAINLRDYIISEARTKQENRKPRKPSPKELKGAYETSLNVNLNEDFEMDIDQIIDVFSNMPGIIAPLFSDTGEIITNNQASSDSAIPINEESTGEELKGLTELIDIEKNIADYIKRMTETGHTEEDFLQLGRNEYQWDEDIDNW